MRRRMASSRIFLATTPHGGSDVSVLIRQSISTPSGRSYCRASCFCCVRPSYSAAKPVPVNFRKLRSPRRDMVLVAAAGPSMNIALAVLAALAFHLLGYLPVIGARWLADNLKNALILNVVLAVFNLFPLPPLDGGRILVGILPKAAGAFVARLEPYGLAILIGLLIVLPLVGAQLGIDLDVVSRALAIATGAIIEAILHITGNI